MNRLINKSPDGTLSVTDIHGREVPLKDIPHNLLGCIYKLKDYESSGYNPDYVALIPYILEDAVKLLSEPANKNIVSCVAMLKAVIKEKDR